jgi:hypothetical protein
VTFELPWVTNVFSIFGSDLENSIKQFQEATRFRLVVDRFGPVSRNEIDF